MGKFLKRFFIKKDIQDTMELRKEYGRYASVMGLIVNFVLAVMKILIGLFSNSIAIVADGVNNLSDMLSNVVSLFSFYISSQPPDKEHPYGHARMEYLASSVVALIIVWVGIGLFRESIRSIRQPEPIDTSILTIVLLIVSILAKLWLWKFYDRIGKKINSELLITTGIDSRNDVLSTTAVLVSIIVMTLTGLLIDGIVGLIVSIIVIYSGWDILKSTFDSLIGEGPSTEQVEKITEFIKSYDGVLGIHDLMLHDYGPGNHFLTVHVEVDAKADFKNSHELIDQIERDLKETFDYHSTIHMDPLDIDDPKTKLKYREVKQSLRDIDPVLKFHDFRILEEYGETLLIFDVVMPYDYYLSEGEVEEKLQENLKLYDENNVIEVTYDRAFYEELDYDRGKKESKGKEKI